MDYRKQQQIAVKRETKTVRASGVPGVRTPGHQPPGRAIMQARATTALDRQLSRASMLLALSDANAFDVSLSVCIRLLASSLQGPSDKADSDK